MDILNIIQGSPKPADSDLMTSGRKSSDDDKLNSMRGSETKSSATKSSSKKPCKKCACLVPSGRLSSTRGRPSTQKTINHSYQKYKGKT